jgi:glycerol-1-phosphate dehydrogenase [NAD(P)+]
LYNTINDKKTEREKTMDELFYFQKATDISCTCGETHRILTQKTIVDHSLLEQIPPILNQLNLGKKCLIVFDENTYQAAGQKIVTILNQEKYETIPLLLSHNSPTQYLEPDEDTRHQVGTGLRYQPDFMIAVGSGVINDLVKFVAHRSHLPYVVVGTAASMDGYPSLGAPMLVNGYKITFEATPPKAIFMDLDVLVEAPLDLLQSGFSDLIGKTTANSDWVLRHQLQDEYICHYSWDLVKEALRILWESADQIPQRKSEAVRALSIALLNSGFSMALVGDSRPASGAEHLIAHYLEMISLSRGENTSLHGLRVGVATLFIHKMYQRFLKEIDTIDWEKIASPHPIRVNKEILQEKFGSLYPSVEKEATQKITSPMVFIDSFKKPGFTNHLRQMISEKLFAIPDVEQALKRSKTPSTFEELGFPRSLVKDSFLFSRFVRSRITILDILDQAGLLEEYVEEFL